jgi:hypothetical protein
MTLPRSIFYYRPAAKSTTIFDAKGQEICHFRVLTNPQKMENGTLTSLAAIGVYQ